MMNWISVKDKLPAHGEYLCFDGSNIWVANYMIEEPNEPRGWLGRQYWSFKTDNDDCCFCICPKLNDVTHWMLLPEKPTVKVS